MVEQEMVDEVKRLLSEGYSPDKIKVNLIKLGYTAGEVEETLRKAAPKTTEDVIENELGLETSAEEEPSAPQSEDDLLLSAGSASMDAPMPAPEPPKPAAKRAARTAAAAPEPVKPPETVASDKKKSGGFLKALVIMLIAALVIAALAYYIGLPKLGIDPATVLPPEIISAMPKL